MSSKLEEVANSRFEYIECMLDGGVAAGSAKHTEMSKKVVDLIMKQLHFVDSIECTAGRRLMKVIRKSPLVGLHKQELMCRLDDKVDLSAIEDSGLAASDTSGLAAAGSGEPSPDAIAIASPAKKAKPQVEHRTIHNYGTAKLWNCICDRQLTLEPKLQEMGVFMKLIGLRYFTEKTAGAATALCRHFTVLVDDSPDKALSQQRRLKDILRCLWKDLPACELPAGYPPTPEEFLAMYPLWYRTAYADGPPVESPVHWQAAKLLEETQPCRSTKTGCSSDTKTAATSKQLASFGWPASQQIQMMNQLQRAQYVQDMAMAAARGTKGGDDEFDWLKMCPQPRQVSVPGVFAGGRMFADIAPPSSTAAQPNNTVVAPPVQEAATRAPAVTSGNDVVAPPVPEGVAMPPGVGALFGVAPTGHADARAPGVKSLFGIAPARDTEALALGSSSTAIVVKKPTMADISLQLRQKLDADKAIAAAKREALKKTADKKVARAKGKGSPTASTKANVKQVAVAKGKRQAKPPTKKLAIKDGSADSKGGGSCPNDSLDYRGTTYDKVRYYKNSTIYHDIGREVWRVKPCPGSRQTIKKSFRNDPKQAWGELVATVRKLNP